MDAFSGLPDWAITTVIGIIGFSLLWLNRQRLGLGEAQMATRSEQHKVIGLQEKRIALLEQEVEHLTKTVDYLSSENDEYRRRIQRLEAREDEHDG